MRRGGTLVITHAWSIINVISTNQILLVINC